MRYAVTTRFIFTGTFYVEAETPGKARESVEKDCGLVINGGIHTSLPDDEADWDFPVHPEKIIGRIRKQKE
jgi:hypothetical protein